MGYRGSSRRRSGSRLWGSMGAKMIAPDLLDAEAAIANIENGIWKAHDLAVIVGSLRSAWRMNIRLEAAVHRLSKKVDIAEKAVDTLTKRYVINGYDLK
jgi:hypothetical protein